MHKPPYRSMMRSSEIHKPPYPKVIKLIIQNKILMETLIEPDRDHPGDYRTDAVLRQRDASPWECILYDRGEGFRLKFDAPQ